MMDGGIVMSTLGNTEMAFMTGLECYLLAMFTTKASSIEDSSAEKVFISLGQPWLPSIPLKM